MRHVVDTMGTVASVDVPESFASVLPQVVSVFHATDERFSLYRADSELSRVASGELGLPDASETLRASYERSMQWSTATSGLFSAQRPDGVLDLNGIVKAEAIESAGRLLDSVGCPSWSINVGGDILVRSASEPWVTGIADPHDPGAILCSVPLTGARRALATSGSAHRGDHIWLGGRLAPAHFVQASVIADDIVTADVLATAIIAGGPDALDEITERWSIDVLVMTREGQLLATPGLRREFALAAG